jgi:hypothetical protein
MKRASRFVAFVSCMVTAGGCGSPTRGDGGGMDSNGTVDAPDDGRADAAMDAGSMDATDAASTEVDVTHADVVIPTDGPATDPCDSSSARFVSTRGDDSNSGEHAAPWRTFLHALRALRAGDTLCAFGGDYVERVQAGRVTAGTSSAPVEVRAVAGERPVIHGLLWVSGADYWHFHGIDVTWDSGNSHDEHMVKFTDGANWEFADAEVWGAESFAAILVAGAPSSWALRRLYVHDTADITVTGHSVNQDHLIYVNAGEAGGVIERCILVNSPNGRGVKLGPPSCGAGATANVVLRYNTLVDNLGPSNVQFSCESHDNRAEHNLMVHSLTGRANVTAFSLTGANNVAADNLGWLSSAVVETSGGVVDGGGNVMREPMFVDAAARDFRPRDTMAMRFGVYAP